METAIADAKTKTESNLAQTVHVFDQITAAVEDDDYKAIVNEIAEFAKLYDRIHLSGWIVNRRLADYFEKHPGLAEVDGDEFLAAVTRDDTPEETKDHLLAQAHAFHTTYSMLEYMEQMVDAAFEYLADQDENDDTPTEGEGTV